jgi:hypothetical protein
MAWVNLTKTRKREGRKPYQAGMTCVAVVFNTMSHWQKYRCSRKKKTLRLHIWKGEWLAWLLRGLMYVLPIVVPLDK